MSTSTRTVKWSEIKTGDVVLFGPDNPANRYTVQAIGSVIDGGRSVVLADTNEGNPYFYEADDTVTVVDAEKPARPTIDFSLSRYATARDYASAHVSRVNKAETNDLLQAVEAGEKVDAYDLNEALVDAMRGAATRAGQSPLRRIHGKQIAHLHHIVQAVLESHADGLPAYAEGDRSRAVEDAKESVKAAMAEIQRLTAALEAEKLQVAQAEANYADLADDFRRVKAERDDAQERERILSLTIGYTRGLGTAEQSAQSLGYQHGLEGR